MRTENQDTTFYAFCDYQQNLLALTDVSGKPYERYSYDPWGNRRSATDWTQRDTLTHHIINRGYTLHEHLEEFGLINMNGRMYDPKLACFLSPDPVISDAGNWLDYNRYSYAWGNPLKYCDPTGMSETEGDRQRRRAEAEHTPSDNNEPIMQWESQNGVIYKIFDCGDKYQFQANYNITCYGLGFMSKGGKTGKSEFDAGFDNSDLTKTLSQFQSGMENSYNAGGYGKGQNITWSCSNSVSAANAIYNTLGEAKCNSLYWIQKNGKVRKTSSIGKNPLLQRSYNLAKNSTSVARNLGKATGVIGAGISVVQFVDNPTSANAFDLAMSLAGFIPGVGWAISSTYFVANVASMATTGKTIGENIFGNDKIEF